MSVEARRLEELTLNSSAPPGQLLYDGWLLRLAPGKAKRARSVNAVYPSRLPLAEKIAYCERRYAEARLPALFRMTPFSEPAGLDEALERRAYGRFDTTLVQEAAIPSPPAGADPGVAALALPDWIEAIGELRGASREHRAAHLARLAGMPLAMRALVIEEGGRVLATGLVMAEGAHAGLFDIVTAAEARRRGFGRRMVAGLFGAARELGAAAAYLQVSAENHPALALYARFGFAERYRYWYRGREGEQG